MSSELLEKLGQVLLSSLWQGAIFGVVLLILLAFIRQAKWRYGLACLTLFAMLAWFVGSTVSVVLPARAVSVSQNPVTPNKHGTSCANV
jgi:phosphoglycerol transferase MdoB-like AlkP superfamily enzyme